MPEAVFGQEGESLFRYDRINALVAVVVFSFAILLFTKWAKEGKPLFLRKIPGLEAIEEAVGRAPKTGFGLGVLLAREPRTPPLNLLVTHDPQKDNPAHSLIEGLYIRETCHRLAEVTQVVIPAMRS